MTTLAVGDSVRVRDTYLDNQERCPLTGTIRDVCPRPDWGGRQAYVVMFDDADYWFSPGGEFTADRLELVHPDRQLASCGCPVPPEVTSGEVQALGWHLRENHPELAPRIEFHDGTAWDECAGMVHRFRVNEHFARHLTGPTHLLVCADCGLHLHADFEVDEKDFS